MDDLVELGPLRPAGLGKGTTELEDRPDYNELMESPRLRLRSCPSPRMFLSPRSYRRFKNQPIQLSPDSGPSNSNILLSFDSNNKEKVNTSYGTITVGIQGDRRRPAMITYHDLGLNANSCFQSFFQFSEMANIAERFCVYHINAPGQEEDAQPLPANFTFPSMDDLAHMITSVVEHFSIRSFIGFGVGMGANILIRYALKNSKKVDCLILVNGSVSKAGWMEWGYQKVNMNYLRNRGMTTFTRDYLMWYHFGRRLDDANPDLLDSYSAYFAQMHNAPNLADLMECHLHRAPIPLVRGGVTLDCPVLQIVGGWSPHLNDTVDLMGKLCPTKSDWMKVSDATGLVLEEQPAKATEAIMLFLQGYGHFPSISHTRWAQTRSASMQMDTTPVRLVAQRKRTSLATIPDSINDSQMVTTA